MNIKRTSIFSVLVIAAISVVGAGCTEEVSPEQPQAQSQYTTPQDGPISGMATQGGGSALGGAKRAGENLASQAEAHSQQVADEADRIMNDDE